MKIKTIDRIMLGLFVLMIVNIIYRIATFPNTLVLVLAAVLVFVSSFVVGWVLELFWKGLDYLWERIKAHYKEDK
jgi:hypothetical protein